MTNMDILKKKFGDNYPAVLGSKGGKAKVKKGFAANPDLASKVSRGRHIKVKQDEQSTRITVTKVQD